MAKCYLHTLLLGKVNGALLTLKLSAMHNLSFVQFEGHSSTITEALWTLVHPPLDFLVAVMSNVNVSLRSLFIMLLGT